MSAGTQSRPVIRVPVGVKVKVDRVDQGGFIVRATMGRLGEVGEVVVRVRALWPGWSRLDDDPPPGEDPFRCADDIARAVRLGARPDGLAVVRNTGESCQSCPSDCFAQCGTQCLACATNTDCPAGYICGSRRCDGARACYPNGDPTASCDRVGTERCPAVAAYNVCTGDSECGPYAACAAYGDGRRICSRRCSTDFDCPSPPSGYPNAWQQCDTRSLRCFLNCTGPGTCPFGLSCFRFDTGTYGYCS